MSALVRKLFSSPIRECALLALLIASLLIQYFFPGRAGSLCVLASALLGSILPLIEAVRGLREKRITIEAFNFFALCVAFITGEYVSAAFIALMLTFAAYLDWRTDSRATNAVEALLKLKPEKATREVGGVIEEIPSDTIKSGDTLVVRAGDRVPVDGVVIFGHAFLNESSLTGESVPVAKTIGDEVFAATTVGSSVLKIRATKVGADSTIMRMARLVEEASKEKSKAQRLADRFAGIFLPVVAVAGGITYAVTGNAAMTAALFLVVCADDIAVSIPLAVTASLGQAAKRGVIIKGGQWLDVLARVRLIAFDKTGTLTYGTFAVSHVELFPNINEKKFWQLVGSAEKFSEHPTGRAVLKKAQSYTTDIPDPDSVEVLPHQGIKARSGNTLVYLGTQEGMEKAGVALSSHILERIGSLRTETAGTIIVTAIDGKEAGLIVVSDKPRSEAKESLSELIRMGVRPIMLTGDSDETARAVAHTVGITDFRANITPTGKYQALAELSKKGKLAMIGDGINDAPALARADVGIAMGVGGSAIAVETANIVILTDRLDRIPETIALARRTVSVVNADMAIWFVTNALGVYLVFTGVLTPALAALYNFGTDFIPVLNSLRLFRTPRGK